jgi:hypothetical protein
VAWKAIGSRCCRPIQRPAGIGGAQRFAGKRSDVLPPMRRSNNPGFSSFRVSRFLTGEAREIIGVGRLARVAPLHMHSRLYAAVGDAASVLLSASGKEDASGD